MTTAQAGLDVLSTSSLLGTEPSLPSPDDDEPLLNRVDEKTMKRDELIGGRRFNITIKSVHYYRSQTSRKARCAVVLKTQFLLMGDKLKTALVPLTACPSAKTSQNDRTLIVKDHIPHDTEWVCVDKRSEKQTTIISPTVKFNAFGGGVEASGVGVNREGIVKRTFMISLEPVRIAGSPACLDWYYHNNEGNFYLRETNVLLVVEKGTASSELYFPFGLKLDMKLYVDVHGVIGTVKKVIRYVVKTDNHDGWYFRIKGKYYPDLAKKAIQEEESGSSVFANIGLRASTKPFLDASSGPH